MNEQFPQNSQEHPTEAEIIAGLEKNEKNLEQEAVSFFESMGPEKVKSKAASLLLASVLSFNSFSAFAGEQGADNIGLPDMGEETITKTLENAGFNNKVADFDWNKTVGKIELSVGTKTEDTSGYKGERINAWEQRESAFFKDTTAEQINQTNNFIYQAITSSQNANEFLTNLSVLSQKGATSLNEKQKIIAVQQFTSMLGATYNMDMLKAENYVAVSDDAMFQALKNHYYGLEAKSGICTNIHIAALRYAKALGLGGEDGKDVFIQTGQTSTGPHAWMGMIVGSGSERQIVFNDYGVLLPADTLNYKDALSVSERYHKAVSLFNNYVGDDARAFFPVDSRASEAIKSAAGIEGPADSLKRNLEQGEVSHEERGLSININPEVKSIKLNADTGVFSFTQLRAENNPYQSLQNMDALHAGFNAHGENLGVRGGLTMVNMDIKGLNGEKATPYDAVIGSLTFDALKRGESPESITKLGHGKIVAEMGAVVTGVVKMAQGHETNFITDMLPGEKTKDDTKEENIQLAFGTRFMYVSPNDMSKVYFDASWTQADRLNNFEQQQSSLKTIAENFALGGEFKVYEGTVLNLEAGRSINEWGTGESAKVGLKGETIKAGISYEKKDSDYERFVPDTSSAKATIDYRINKDWEVGIYAAKDLVKYKDMAEGQKISNAGVTLRMRLD